MDEKILDIFKSEENYISGEHLSQVLGVSRTAIWKHIEKLRQEGYDIVAQPNLGYKLIGAPDKLLPAELAWKLGTKIIGCKIFSYEVVDSTMDIAYSLAEGGRGKEGAAEGTCVFSEGQRKGRGRLGRSWNSPKAKGIYLSVILRPEITPSEAAKVTLIAAVSVAKAIREMTPLLALIKWPNDVLINTRKVCGILTDMSAEVNRVKFIILGIGLNVNTQRGDLPKMATSLKEEVKSQVSRIDMTRSILRQLEAHYFLFKKNGFGPIVDEWKDLSAILGRRVKVICRDRRIEGQAQDIDDGGCLVIRQDSGFSERISAGDVTVVR